MVSRTLSFPIRSDQPRLEMIDLMDNEGKLKEMNAHPDEYASQYLNPRNTYYVLKIESRGATKLSFFDGISLSIVVTDATSNEKRYTANFNLEQIDQKLASTFMSNARHSIFSPHSELTF